MPAKKSIKPKNNNLELWNQVCETNPAITKRVNTRGGFTSIDAQSQVKKATELWGKYGHKWGLKDLAFENICDASTTIGVSLVATFWYPLNDGSGTAQFPVATDIKYKAGDDCFKKLTTDALTKALSRLGFNSDVFEGRFDDNKYVAEMEAKYKKETVPDIKTYTPDETAKKLMVKIAAKYKELDGIYFQDNEIDMDKLAAAIFNKYGKYPSKASAVDTITKTIDVKDVSVKKG